MYDAFKRSLVFRAYRPCRRMDRSGYNIDEASEIYWDAQLVDLSAISIPVTTNDAKYT